MKYKQKLYLHYYKSQSLAFLYRYDPVPRIRRFKYNRYFRNIRTTQERRWSYADDSKYVRSKRRAYSLPSVWDDIIIFYSRSWKKQKKKKQWM